MPTTIKTNAAGTLAELLLNATSVAQFSQNAVTFPQLAQSLTPAGYAKLPGGLIVQWGSALLSTTAANTWVSGAQPLPIAFPNANLRTVCSIQGLSLLTGQGGTCEVRSANMADVVLSAMTFSDAVSNITVNYIAIGH